MIPKKYKKYSPVYFAKGKRSLVYKFKKDNQELILKIKNPDSEAVNRLKNEANYLKLLNQSKIGPKLVDKGKDYVVMEFIKGKFLKDLKLNKKQIIEILKQCRIMDKLRINKEEMHHPFKHILINRNKITMIDFERCYETDKPKNVTQFIQYLRNNQIAKVKLDLIQRYKKEQSDNTFSKILDALK